MGIEKTLKRAEVFLGLNDAALARVAALPSCRGETYQTREVIFRMGEEAKHLYILKSGRVDLVMEARPTSIQIVKDVLADRVTTGGFFGWSALVEPHSYAMSAVCREPSVVVIISGTELIALLNEDHYIGYTVLRSLTRIIGRRLREIEHVVMKGEGWPFLNR
ncbi:MAG: cyclic nucleotide-binding domain-containing protein [Dehalococcoidales bacterium]|nr:MAG: cyclic nucleotide-binding domain-containing protein [Dehalococcoidales bacterium]